MRVFIAEKPSVAADLAKVFEGREVKKTGICWETREGIVVNCFGHMLELMGPEGYDPKWENRDDFSTLPILPDRMKLVPPKAYPWESKDSQGFKKRKREHLDEIGVILRKASEVVIATDPDRQGEAIGWNVIDHFNFKGTVRRLWLSSCDEGSVRKAMASMQPASQTKKLATVARSLSEADWLVGLNGTRGVSCKVGAKARVGRVQTATLALVVKRDREIAAFKSRAFFEILAKVQVDGIELTLKHAPEEANRIWDKAIADSIATKAKGASAALEFTEEPKHVAPPKLFKLVALQQAANKKWGWSSDHTLEVAQALYETHKVMTYPRSNCDVLKEEQLADVPTITKNLLALGDFAHLRDTPLKPRKTVFSGKDETHFAIIPNLVAPNLSAFSADERKLYLLIAFRYLASMMPDYEYLSSTIQTVIDGRVYSVSGKVMLKPGWKAVEGDDEEDEDAGDKSKETNLPKLPAGSVGTVAESSVDSKKTKPPSAYTEATLLGDMENIAKYVTNPEHKALLRSKEGKVGSQDTGIGTSATRGDIIAKLRTQEAIKITGKKIVSTKDAQDLIAYLERDLPVLVDFGATAVWESKLGEVADGTKTPEAFRAEIYEFVRQMIATLSSRASVAKPGLARSPGEPTGVMVRGKEIQRHKDVENGGKVFYSVEGVPGRLYADVWGHLCTPEEIQRMIEKEEVITVDDCKTQSGALIGVPKKLRYDAKKKPFPGILVVDETQRVDTGAEAGKKGGVTRCVTTTGVAYYTIEKVKTNGVPVRFWANSHGKEWTAEEIAAIVESGKDGVEFSDLKKKDGTVYSARIWYNARKAPAPGLDFVSG